MRDTTTYGYLSMLLIALAGIRYQASNVDPFHEHATIMLLFLTAALTYVIAFSQLKLLTDHNNQRWPILRALCHVSGILANELLLLLLMDPLPSFIINVSSILLVQLLSYCYQYVSPLINLQGISLKWMWNYFVRKAEQQSASVEILDLEAPVIG